MLRSGQRAADKGSLVEEWKVRLIASRAMTKGFRQDELVTRSAAEEEQG